MENELYLSASLTGHDGKLTLTGIFEMLQDAMTFECGRLGIDNISLKNKYNAMWVYSKNKAIVYRRPEWNEHLYIHSRIVKANKLLCYFKTECFDENHELLFYGLVECCILNKETFKFVKLSTIPFEYTEEACDTSYSFNNLEEKNVSSFRVSESLIDLSNHLNNAKAFTPLMDSLGKDCLDEIYSNPFEVQIKYCSQAMLGSILDVLIGKEEDQLTFSFVNAEQNIVDTGLIKKIK